MQNHRIVPWRDFDEWKRVYEGLYASRTSKTFQWAIKRARLWKIRGRVPVSVEATICLLEAFSLYDESAKNSFMQGRISSYDIQMLFGIAITRFVNGIVDRQQRGAFALPVIQIASEMNLPRVLVDIRHAATHDSLPSLPLLLRSAQLALDWLEENYWAVQLKHKDDVRSQLPDLLIKYKEIRKQELKQQQLLEVAEDEDDELVIPLGGECLGLLNDLFDLCPPPYHHDVLTAALLKEGFLVPLAKKKRPSVEAGDQLPRSLICLWDPLLQSIVRVNSDFTVSLLEAIFDKLYVRLDVLKPNSYLNTLAVWASWLIKELIEDQNNDVNQGDDKIRCVYRKLISKPRILCKYLIELKAFDSVRDEFKETTAICISSSEFYYDSSSSPIANVDFSAVETQIESMKSLILKRKRGGESSVSEFPNNVETNPQDRRWKESI